MGRVDSLNRNLFLQIICLLMGAALLGICSNQVREEPLSFFQPLPRRSLEYIELDEAHERLKSERVAQLLLHRGHGRVLVMKAGFSGWSARGFPTE